MKIFLPITIFISSCFINAFAQNETETDINLLQSAIEQHSASINSLSGEFIQTKELSSLGVRIEQKGKFYFKKLNNKFRWEYKTPTQFIIIYSEGNFKIKQYEHIDQNKAANEVFTELNKILLQTLRGNLETEDNFIATAFEGTSCYRLVLVPELSGLKELLSNIQLTFDKNTFQVKEILLSETTGDLTRITLINLTENPSLPNSLFE